MTLTTRVRIVEPTPVKPVFEFMRKLLSAEHGEWYEIREPQRYDKPEWFNPSIHNTIGQGFAALMWVEYGGDGFLRDEPDCYADDCDTYPCSDVAHQRVTAPRASVEVFFDTSYASRTERGGNCSDLHAWLIQELGRWCDARGLNWHWYDEFKGEWHASTDPVTTLGNPDKGALLTSVR